MPPCFSQVLSQDLLRVSTRLESLEEQLGGSGQAGHNRVVTAEELEKERDSLRKRRDILNTQLRDGKGLSTKVRTRDGDCVFVYVLASPELNTAFCSIRYYNAIYIITQKRETYIPKLKLGQAIYKPFFPHIC